MRQATVPKPTVLENETIRNYRDRVRQCEALGEYAMAEQIRQILMQEQDHQIDLATALGHEQTNRPYQCGVCFSSVNKLQSAAKLVPRRGVVGS